MAISGRWIIECDGCHGQVVDKKSIDKRGVPCIYEDFSSALAEARGLKGWFVSEERDNSRFLLCPDCVRQRISALVEEAQGGATGRADAIVARLTDIFSEQLAK